MKRYLFILLLSLNTIYQPISGYAVSVARPQTTNTSASLSIMQRQMQLLVQSFNAAKIPYFKNSSCFINDALQKDISSITTALFLSCADHPLLQAKAFLNALYFNASSDLPAFQKGQELLAQRFCDATGKLVRFECDRETSRSIIKCFSPRALGELRHMFQPSSNKAFTQSTEHPSWLTFWNKTWDSIVPELAKQDKISACSIEQARENRYNKDLYALFSLCEKQQFDQAEALVQQYESDKLFKSVYDFHHHFFQQKEKQSQAYKLQQMRQQRPTAKKRTVIDPKPFWQNYPLSQLTRKYLQQANIQSASFQNCHGTHMQQQVHKELVKINKQAAKLEEKTKDDPEVKKITRHIPQFTKVAHDYNKAGLIKEALVVTDFCWSLLDCAFRITYGIGSGIILGVENYLTYLFEHPIQALARPLIGNLLCAVRLAQLTYRLINIGAIGLGKMKGSETATEQWQLIQRNMSFIKMELMQKFNTMSLEQFSQETTAFATQFLLDYQCAHALSNFYQSALNDAQEYLNSNAVSPLTTIDNVLLNVASQATTILAGQGSLLIQSIKKYSSNGITASMEATLHDHIQALIPQNEFELIVAPYNSKKDTALFKPGIDSRKIANNAWQNGNRISQESCKVYRCENIIGAVDGKPTRYLKVKKVDNVLFAKPITYKEFRTLLKTMRQA